MILADGNDAIFLNLDLTREKSCEKMAAETINKYRKLDIAINNAGVMGNPSLLHELEQINMDYIMANNFYRVYFCCKHEIR